MQVYDIEGNIINSMYTVDGDRLNYAYDIEGNLLDNNLVVMSYNIQRFGGINSQRTMQREIIGKYMPDIIGLQECGSGAMPSVGVDVLSAYQYQSLGVQTNKTAFASKFQLEDATSATFINQGGETRGYNKAYISFLGKRICWINTHLEYASSAAKYKQMNEVLAMAELEEYVIITGDFNSCCQAVDHADYIGQYKPYVDGGYQLANCSAEAGFTKTWGDITSASSTDDLTYPCDSIITSSNILIKQVVFDTTKFDYLNGSSIDHIPIIALLEIN